MLQNTDTLWCFMSVTLDYLQLFKKNNRLNLNVKCNILMIVKKINTKFYELCRREQT